MDFALITEILNAIEAEGRRREARYSEMDPEIAAYQSIYDEGFLRGFYLLALVFVWHQVERELVHLAAQADGNVAEPMSSESHTTQVRDLSKPGNWQKIKARLSLEKAAQYSTCWGVLRPLVNSYKHDAFAKPNEELLLGLKLDSTANYAPLTESDALREALCNILGLPEDEQYAGIASAFVQSCNRFLADVRASAPLRKVQGRRGSFKPSDAGR